MKIVSWNCCWGFTKGKQEAILEAFPKTDIFVIQECRRDDLDTIGKDWKFKNWYGDDVDDNSKLGIAVFSKEYKLEFTDQFNRNLRYVVPYRVIVGEKSLILFAVWTKSWERGHFDYDDNVTKAVFHYRDLMNGDALIIGDFNTFATNKNDELKTLEKKMEPMINCAKDPGFWETSTYYHNENSGYGIDDFCFASESLSANRKITFEIKDAVENKASDPKKWRDLSDHWPISVDFCF